MSLFVNLSYRSVLSQPQRIHTAMSLYSESLSGLILLVDNRLNTYSGVMKGLFLLMLFLSLKYTLTKYTLVFGCKMEGSELTECHWSAFQRMVNSISEFVGNKLVVRVVNMWMTNWLWWCVGY